MNRVQTSARIPAFLLVLVAIYCAASLIHFAHNAEFVKDYPNLPLWLTRSKVYLAWLAVTSVGVLGVTLLGLRRRLLGLLILMVYAALGFAGLDHYWVAPFAAHSIAMNATIWFEVTSAAALFVAALVLVRKKLFADGSAPHSFKLTRSRVTSTGVPLGHYQRDGEIKISDGALDSSSKREIARQERMKCED